MSAENETPYSSSAEGNFTLATCLLPVILAAKLH